MIRFISLCCIVLLFPACQKKKSADYNQPYHSLPPSSKQKEQEKDERLLKGEDIFDNQCAACHRMDRKLVGPSLQGITQKYDKEWLISFIKDNQTLIQKKDSAALKIWLEYNKSPMPSFNHLTEDEFNDLYYYLEYYQTN